MNLVPEINRSLRRNICPVCAARTEAEKRYMSAIPLRIGHNDEEVERFLTEEGLCNLHCWDLINLASPATVARFCYLALKRVASELEWAKGLCGTEAALRLKSVFRRPRTEGELPCAACRAIHSAERDILQAIITQLADDEFRDIYRRSGGLCAPHAILLLESLPNEQDAHFVTQTLSGALQKLALELQPFSTRVEPKQWQRQSSFGVKAMRLLVGVRRVEPT